MKVISSRTLVLAAIATFAIAACAHDPVADSKTIEQKADAVYGEYVIAKEQVQALLADPSVDAATKTKIANATVATTPAADDLFSGLTAYSSAESDLVASKGTQAAVDTAVANLSKWLAQAQPLVDELMTLVGGAKK